MLYKVSEDEQDAIPISEITFEKCGIKEIKNIQEWIRKDPRILGEELLVLSVNRCPWDKSRREYDILSMDKSGQLVLIEIKRDNKDCVAQGLDYASKLVSMTRANVLPYFIEYREKYCGEKLSLEEAKIIIDEFTDSDEVYNEFPKEVRIILVAAGFSNDDTQLALYLNSLRQLVKCVKLTLYTKDNELLFNSNTIIPVKETEQYLVGIKEKEDQRILKTKKGKAILDRLINDGIVKIGEILSFQYNLPKGVEYNKDNPIFHAEVIRNENKPARVRWEVDKEEYSLCKLTDKICEEKFNLLPRGWYSTKMWGIKNTSCLVELLKQQEDGSVN